LASGRLPIPVIVGAFENTCAAAPWFVVVDARMRKRAIPENQRGLAPLVIDLGLGFIAGETVGMAIATARGDELGRVITDGSPSALAGEPRSIEGAGRDRNVYAPTEGIWHTRRNIGDTIKAGQLVGWMGETPIAAPLGGLLRGLTHDGVPCARGTKIVEVDPRSADKAVIRGLGERPRRIADAVISAVQRVFAAPLPRHVL
jgi:xanthine dehydrogenase accessory factor